MKKTIAFTPLLILLLLPTYVHAQARNEIPMYGGIPPNKAEAEADATLIEWTIQKFGSREAGAKNAIRLGFKYLENGDWSTAMKRFNQAWLLGGETAETDWGFAAALSYQGKFGDAEKFFLKARERDGKNARLLTDFGFLYQFWATKGHVDKQVKAEYLDKSIELFDQASQVDPAIDRIYFNWAVSLYFKKDYSGAWKKIAEAEKLGGKSIDQKFLKDLTKKMPRPATSSGSSKGGLPCLNLESFNVQTARNTSPPLPPLVVSARRRSMPGQRRPPLMRRPSKIGPSARSNTLATC
jgi:tetratricopeptide (TPR) repeat protein